MLIDLDEVQAGIDRWNGLNTEDATAVVAELRAARQVIDAAIAHRMDFEACQDPYLSDALDGHDQVVGKVGG